MEGVILGAAVGLAVWFGRDAETKAGLSDAGGGLVDSVSDGVAMLRLSLMRGLDPALLKNSNLKAFLKVIRTGEGTADAGGYNRLFGGGSFASFADHPRQVVCKTYAGGRLCSSAAGAYQAIASTWDETKRIMGLADFSPGNQDLFALGRIAARGALDDVLAGRFESALSKVAREWASMPGSPYGQPTITLSKANAIYTAAGGFYA